jgi:hypothetical protein
MLCQIKVIKRIFKLKKISPLKDQYPILIIQTKKGKYFQFQNQWAKKATQLWVRMRQSHLHKIRIFKWVWNISQNNEIAPMMRVLNNTVRKKVKINTAKKRIKIPQWTKVNIVSITTKQFKMKMKLEAKLN